MPKPGKVRISIHALLAESDPSRTRKLTNMIISIHALLAESDNFRCSVKCAICNFYPRSPCGERRLNPPKPRRFHYHFYPRSPCGERPFEKFEGVIATKISIHALLAESDPPVRDIIQWEGIFLSTLSLRRATPYIIRHIIDLHPFLSTLSLRRATNCTSIGRPKRLYFYPRSPCGERLHNLNLPSKPIENFYPRSPCGERQCKL